MMARTQKLTVEIFRQTFARFKQHVAGVHLWPGAAQFSSFAKKAPTPKVLLVVAHPDDESECAALIYRITHELGGAVDQLIVTNGEGGHRYSALGDVYYGLSIGEKQSRSHLVRVRRQEVRRAGRILGIRRQFFLNQKDTGLTWNPHEGFQAWQVERLRRQLLARLESENYDLVFLLLPTPHTHGHHQSVAVLVLEAISRLRAEQRPAALGVQTITRGATHAGVFEGLEEFPVTRTTHPAPVWQFDRRTPMRCHRALDYSIVANWVIAEHKSQGMFQMQSGRRSRECFWLFDVCGTSGAARWSRFLHLLEADFASSEECREDDGDSQIAAAFGKPAQI